MALKPAAARVVANACLTRYERGERGILDIVYSYQMGEEDRTQVLAEIYAKRSVLAEI